MQFKSKALIYKLMVGCCFKGALHYFLDILVILHLIQHSDYNMSTHAQNANTYVYDELAPQEHA